jgi:hypothetical protein
VARTIAARLPAQTGVAVAPLPDGAVRSVGAASPTVAWSTMKIPVIVTVIRQRRAGELPGGTELTTTEREAIRRAITASDNAAAQTLYAELAARYDGDQGATRQIDRVLQLAGDTKTQVNARFSRPEFSNFGQTRWSLREMVLFYRALATGRLLEPSDRALVTGAMGDVDANQRWGASIAHWRGAGQTLVKGGWGPTVDGAMDVLQAAIVPGRHGFVIAFATVAATFEAGQARLTELARIVAEATA